MSQSTLRSVTGANLHQCSHCQGLYVTLHNGECAGCIEEGQTLVQYDAGDVSGLFDNPNDYEWLGGE